MSFALVPCNEALRLTLAAYLTGDDDETNFDNLQMILEDLIEFTYGTGHSNALTLTQNDDFFGFIECLSGKNQKFDESYQLDKNYQLEDRTCDQLEVPASTNIILVGAAGNSGPGYLFPFAPALWNQVVSVSASEIDGVMANYSNTGEVMMLGTTQYTDVSVPLDDGSTILTDVVGTSFASPRLALDRAQYLLSITDSNLGFKCQGNAGIWASPPLGYIPEAGDWESGVTTDLMLTDAKSEYCP
jgi:hypothetical protein